MNEKKRHNRRKQVIRLGILLVAVLLMAAGLPLLGEKAQADTKPTMRAPALKTITHSGTKLTVTWEPEDYCSGYQIQYADNRLFQGKFSRSVKGASRTSKVFKGVSSSDTYYVRIRTYVADGSKKTYSPWTLASNVKGSASLGKTPVRKLLKRFEIRSAAKQKVPGFDTLQGSCYGKGYAYFLLENRTIPDTKARCKIVKVKLSNMKVVKVSSALKVGHGNDMTYDTKRGRIVVAHSSPTPKTISTVSPSTLKVTSTYTVEMPAKVPGLSEKSRSLYNGFGLIAYNAAHDKYVVCLRGQKFHHLVILNSNFKPVSFMWLNRAKGEMAKQMVQGMDSYGDFIMVAQSYGYGYSGNNILLYDWNGHYLSKMNLGNTYELESIFHTKDGLYAGMYTSFYKKTVLRGNVLKRNNYLYKLTKY